MHQFAEQIEHFWLISKIATSNPVYGTLTAMHYFTLFVLTGTAVAFDLHLLGLVAKDKTSTNFAEDIFPWTWTALGFALFSGTVLMLTDAGDYYGSPVMRTKILVVTVAVLVTIYIRRSVSKWDKEPSIPGIAKFAAVLSMLLWLSAILLGNNIAALCGLG